MAYENCLEAVRAGSTDPQDYRLPRYYCDVCQEAYHGFWRRWLGLPEDHCPVCDSVARFLPEQSRCSS